MRPCRSKERPSERANYPSDAGPHALLVGATTIDADGEEVVQTMPTVLGLRQKPGSLALAVFGIVPAVYQMGLGRTLGRTFMLLTYKGRKSGKTYRAALMVLSSDEQTGEVTSLAMYGNQTGWWRNIVANPALAVEIGGTRFRPEQRFLSAEEAHGLVSQFRKAHPWRVRLIALIMGWGSLRSESEVPDFVRTKAFVAFRPAVRGESASR
jgi:deazaflavin-dependent oxidoreductase (nitroreductase family)